ncbi:MFS transporter [Curtobacterium sp. MCBD17_028]|uniref:MFS transporter n=1 Tax=Curtobacterium sp. MCBD17_028 TaxID=2175670 RepID=UPI000DA791DE|nr:MFS transporter [Curtobacterium sp. MCBD17_028]PZE26039.1 MFS transporter [Curtobacterium sp. MCBD17_028]
MTTPTSTRTPGTRTWRNAVFVVFTLSGLDMATWLGRVPSVRDSLHASTSEMGLLVLGMSVGSIVGLSAASHIVARLGARRGIQVAAVLLVVGMVSASIAVSAGWGFWAIWGCLTAFGFGNGLCDVSMNVSGASAERAGGRSVMPLFHAAFSVGTLLGATLGSAAEAAAVPVWIHIGSIGVLASIGMVVAVTRLRDERAEPHPESTDTSPVAVLNRWQVWASPATILIGLIVLGMALAEGAANDWLPLAMVDGDGLTNAEGSAVLSVFVAAMTVGRAGGVFVIDRFGRVPVLRGSAALALVGLLVLILVPSVPLAIVGVVLWGIGASLGFPMGMSAAADDPRNTAIRVSAVATIGYVAFLAGPPVIGFLGKQFGLLHALLVVVVFIVLAGLASGAARERTRPQVEPRPSGGTPASGGWTGRNRFDTDEPARRR